MNPRLLRICFGQINTTVGDLAGNSQKVRQALLFAARGQADLAVFPELTLTGYPPEDLLFQKHFIRDNLAALHSLLPFTSNLSAVVGFVDKDKKGNLYNAAGFLSDKKIKRIYHKTQLPNYGVFDEERYFSAGSKPGIVNIRGIRIGLSVCEDMWERGSLIWQHPYAKGVSLLINISASPFHAGKQTEREKLVKTLAKKTRAAVLYLNLVGGQDELVFDGGSLLVNSGGRLLAQARRFEEEIFVTELPLPDVRPAKRRLRQLSYEEEIFCGLVLGTRDYIKKNGFKKVLIGLSGGIDSALVAAIAAEALGAENVTGVTMPSPYTSKETLSDSKKLAENLGIACLELKISRLFREYLGLLKKPFQGTSPGAAEENLQARIRGSLLMALSNKFGHLVLTTGNKSEMATGYCTLYGDMAGGLAVLKDVPKTTVFKLARHYNARNDRKIPAGILKRPPTAELRHNQKDRDTLPPYPLLDRFLEAYIENDRSADEIIARGFPSKTARRIKKMIDMNEYKRRQSPPGVKITPKAFGRDRRMPITNRYAG